MNISDLLSSPAWLPFKLDQNRRALRFIKLDAQDYARASFLDERLLDLKKPEEELDLASVLDAKVRLALSPHYIFHIGHCGSTLISRLLGAHPGIFALREPSILRQIGDFPWESAADLQSTILRLLARTWRSDQVAVVKATSVVSEQAGAFLENSASSSKALFIFVNPFVYLKSIFAGDNSRVESSTLGPSRLNRLLRRVKGAAWRWDTLSEGEAIAMSWLCEIVTLYEAGNLNHHRVLWINFDKFLTKPDHMLGKIFSFFKLDIDPFELESLLSGPLMKNYSKAQEFPFDVQYRLENLQSAASRHGEEINKGMDWLGAAADHHQIVQDALKASSLI